MLNAQNWKELKKQLIQIQGKAIFELERYNSLNDGKFLRILHQVKAHELVFFDGKQTSTLTITKDMEKHLQFFEGGFTFLNCTYKLKEVMGVKNGNMEI